MAEKRLIDANKLTRYETVMEFGQYVGEDSRLVKVVYESDIDTAPTIDAVDVVHAKWVNTSSPDADDNVDCNCSNCGAGDKHAKGFHVPFCWKCGAKMTEEESEGK